MRWIAATLMALLALAYALVAFAAPSAAVRPAPDDRGPGGLTSFAAALRAAGYRVAFDPSTKPRLSPADVAVVPVLSRPNVEFETPKAAVDFARRGGHAFVLGIPGELQPVGAVIAATDWQGKKASVVRTADPGLPETEGQLASATVWRDESGPMASLVQVEGGRIARLEEGALATNRFLGRADDARVVLSTVAKVARPGDRLVFLAGGYGEAEDLGPIEAIGPWAVGALWQSLLVLAAYGVARGIRFGLPAPEPQVRRGARELLDALAGHYRRGRRTDAPLRAVARERTDDVQAQALAARKVSEADARQALMEFEARPRSRHL